MIKSFDAIATCFDFNEGGHGGPYALFSIGDKGLRVPVFVSSAEELRTLMTLGHCRLSIIIESPINSEAKS